MEKSATKLSLLSLYDNISSLSVTKSALEANGIKCYTENENYKYSMGSFAEGMELYVLEEDYERAKQILEQTE